MMKIAVASQNRREVTGHTGRCRKFWIYDISTQGEVLGRQLLELAKSQSFHESSPHDRHPLQGVQVLISGGMGQGMHRRLAAMGIEAAATCQTDPDVAVRAWLDGTLDSVAPETGHDHRAAHHRRDRHDHASEGHDACNGCSC